MPFFSGLLVVALVAYYVNDGKPAPKPRIVRGSIDSCLFSQDSAECRAVFDRF